MHKKVLFINNTSSLLLLSGFLSRMGFDVDVTNGDITGLLKLESRSYDIAIDLESPAAESWVTCDNIRKVSNIPLIIISLNASADTCAKAINAGADFFMRKPFGPLEFQARINSLLQRTASRQTLSTVPA